MKQLLLAASSTLALVVPGGASAAPACQQYRNQAIAAYASQIFAGVRTLAPSERARLRAMEACPRYPASVWWADRWARRQERRHAARVAALPAWSSAVASWFDDAGATACGFHAALGVANKSLPCGTRVTFRYGGQEAAAVVEDRGPFVAGRDWDLNPGLRDALGFDGVGTVEYRIG